jgi:hypothetical protein
MQSSGLDCFGRRGCLARLAEADRYSTEPQRGSPRPIRLSSRHEQDSLISFE